MSGMQMALLGAAGQVVNITLSSQFGLNAITDTKYSFGTAVASYQIASNGRVYKIEGGFTTEIEQWCDPTSQAANYEAFVSLNVGSSGLTSGTVGSWVPLSSTQTWTLMEATSGNSTIAEFTAKIRRIGTTSPEFGFATIELNATVF
jgi:hypothetical protein